MLSERVVEWTKEWKEGYDAGYKTGYEVGYRKGLQKGGARMLIRLLKLKFGTLPDNVRQRIENAKFDTLLEWSDRILTAEYIEEVVKN